MHPKLRKHLCLLVLATMAALAMAQSAPDSPNAVPNLINYSGVLKDGTGKTINSEAGVTFLIYKDEHGGSPLWLETQNVTPDRGGRYTVQLGAMNPNGLPSGIFQNGEARWLAAQIYQEAEQARTLLVAVPYALKAQDAATIGGLPPSAFVLANGGQGAASRSASNAPANHNVTGKGTVDFIPMWDKTSDIANSVLFQKTSKIGISTTTPAATLDVNGKSDVRDTLTLFPKNTDNTLAVNGTAFAISNAGQVNFVSGQTFPGTGTITGITTASGSGLTGGGTSGTLTLGLTTGCSSNQVLRWNGSAWSCASTGTGTITGVTAGTALTGGGTSGNVTLNLDTTKVPLLNAANKFTGNQTVNGTLSATGVVIGSAFQIGSNLFGFGNANSFNAFLGFGGNNTMTGTSNTAIGVEALISNTTGSDNSATGANALFSNTTGNNNTASGYNSLSNNTTGYINTAIGATALASNTTGIANTAAGAEALFSNTTGCCNTATGANALFSNTAGAYNTASGFNSLTQNTTGSYNSATGANALNFNTTGSNNTANGYNSLTNNTTGTYNTANGGSALSGNTTGGNNTGVGYDALESNQTSTDNTAVGFNALATSFGDPLYGGYNTAVGSQALSTNSTGFYNTADGYAALSANTSGTGNTASGLEALVQNSTGGENVAVGLYGLYLNTTGSSNTAIGAYSGYTGDFSYITGSNNTMLGTNAGLLTGTLTNATAIGANAQVWQSNAIVLGGTKGVNGATTDTFVAIADSTPTNIFTIGQGHGQALADGWTTYSSRRWKTNIQTLPDALAKVEKLRGVSYDLKDSGKHEVGVIAEEVGAVVPEVVTFEENGKDARGVDYSRLTALLIEAVKAEQKQIAALRTQLKQRALKEAALERRLTQMEHDGSTLLASSHAANNKSEQ